MLPLAAVAVGALIGFVVSRKLRRPQHVAQAASVARSVSGSVGRRKGLTAPDLQRACFSEMVRHVRVGRDGRTIAPARYLLQLNTVDMELVDETKTWFVDGLRDALTQAAADNGWTVDGTIDIRFEVDAARRAGVPNALAIEPEGAKKPSRAAGPAALALVRADTDERWSLGSAPVTIGRASDRTIVVDDTRVSRSHARVAPARSGWAITDAGSSNGTSHNGRLLTPNVAQPLRAGDRIGVGPVELVVETDVDTGTTTGARALDDRERTRISGEVLPPPRRPRS